MKHSYIMVFGFAVAIQSGFATAQQGNCDAVLDLGINAQEDFSKVTINETYYKMLSMSETELDSLAIKYETKESLEATVKAVAYLWSKNKNNAYFRSKYKTANIRFEMGFAIDNGYLDHFKSQTVNEATLKAWNECKRTAIMGDIARATATQQEDGFVQKMIGDEAGVFTYIINKIPKQGHPLSAKISNVSKNNIEFIGSNNLRVGESIENYTGISQSMRLIDPYAVGSIVVNLEGFAPITKEFSRNSLSNIPIGTVISSTLDFNVFSYETKNHVNQEFNPASSKWAPADGRSVVGSNYARYYDRVPDLRGQFLRGFNIMYSTNQPAEILNGLDIGQRFERNRYSYQLESTKLPTLPFSGATNTSGTHLHNFEAVINTGSQANLDTGGNSTMARGGHRNTAEAGSHQHTISINNGGDNETRPNNMAIYYYIRINK